MPYDSTNPPSLLAFLESLRDLVARKDGWCRYVVRDREGRMCLMGAIAAARFGHDVLGSRGERCDILPDSIAAAMFKETDLFVSEIGFLIRLAIAERDGAVPVDLDNWNDHPDRTQVQVVEVLDRAIALHCDRDAASKSMAKMMEELDDENLSRLFFL